MDHTCSHPTQSSQTVPNPPCSRTIKQNRIPLNCSMFWSAEVFRAAHNIFPLFFKQREENFPKIRKSIRVKQPCRRDTSSHPNTETNAVRAFISTLLCFSLIKSVWMMLLMTVLDCISVTDWTVHFLICRKQQHYCWTIFRDFIDSMLCSLTASL